MRSEIEIAILLKAIDAFKRRLVIISPEFKILAANSGTEGLADSTVVGQVCHQAFYRRSEPCVDCAVQKAKETGQPALHPKMEEYVDLEKMPCLYAYPIHAGNTIEAFVSMGRFVWQSKSPLGLLPLRLQIMLHVADAHAPPKEKSQRNQKNR